MVGDIPVGADQPMRKAVALAYKELTGKDPDFIFSGWGGELTDLEKELLGQNEQRPPFNPDCMDCSSARFIGAAPCDVHQPPARFHPPGYKKKGQKKK